MKFYPIGTSSIRGSEICFGCAGIGGYDYGPVDEDVSLAALKRATDLGINFFDTADVYGFGRSENLLRKAFGKTINQLVVATKFGVKWNQAGITTKDISPTHLKKAIGDSLRRLGVEAIALYQIHWPDGKTKWEDCIAELENQKNAGTILSYGACNIGFDDIEKCQRSGNLASLQCPFSMVDESNRSEMRASITNHSMSTMAYNVLGNGLLTGKYDNNSTFTGTDMRTRIGLFKGKNLENGLKRLARIRDVANTHNVSCAETTLAWTLAQKEVTFAIVGTKTPSQIEQSVAATSLRLTESDLANLARPIN
ncbi:oxidoreductase, aldo/keto reductase family [Verrucomicrobiia bacterium DG1235]|nr:oxidoreductase, aldo/keto reductase family [Verrucomicrobiae bacterium DG1235]